MKKILSVLVLTLILTSCGKTEEEKIINDLDLEIQEFIETSKEDSKNNTNEETVESTENIKIEDKNLEEDSKEDTKEEELPEDSTKQFAKCLSEKGAIMYGTEWCSHCKNQKSMFGEYFSEINYIDCDKNRKKCKDAGIQGYPTWIINGKQFAGVQSFEKLGEETKCELKK